MPQVLLSMLLGVGSLAAVFALWVGVLAYGVRPNVSGLGLGSLMSLIALPPLGLWAASAGAVVWRKRSAERAAVASAEAESAEQKRQIAQAREIRQREIAQRQQPLKVLAMSRTEASESAQPGYEPTCAALALSALDRLREDQDIARWPVLVMAPAGTLPELVRSAQGSEVLRFDDAAAMLDQAFERLTHDPQVAGVVMLAVDAPRAMLDAAPTRFNPDLSQEEPDLDLPLRGEAGQGALALALARDGDALACLHRPGATIADAVLNGCLLSAEETQPAIAPGLMVHNAGLGKDATDDFMKILKTLPAFDRELDPIEDAWNVPRQDADYGAASFWMGLAHAIEHASENDAPVLCVDCQRQALLPLVIAAAEREHA